MKRKIDKVLGNDANPFLLFICETPEMNHLNFLNNFFSQFILIEILVLRRTCRHLHNQLKLLKDQLTVFYQQQGFFKRTLRSHRDYNIHHPIISYAIQHEFEKALSVAKEFKILVPLSEGWHRDFDYSKSIGSWTFNPMRKFSTVNRYDVKQEWQNLLDIANPETNGLIHLFRPLSDPQKECDQWHYISTLVQSCKYDVTNVILSLGISKNISLWTRLISDPTFCEKSMMTVRVLTDIFIKGLCITGAQKEFEQLAPFGQNQHEHSWSDFVCTNGETWEDYTAAFGHIEMWKYIVSINHNIYDDIDIESSINIAFFAGNLLFIENINLRLYRMTMINELPFIIGFTGNIDLVQPFTRLFNEQERVILVDYLHDLDTIAFHAMINNHIHLFKHIESITTLPLTMTNKIPFLSMTCFEKIKQAVIDHEENIVFIYSITDHITFNWKSLDRFFFDWILTKIGPDPEFSQAINTWFNEKNSKIKA
jgi:hypothetical protein